MASRTGILPLAVIAVVEHAGSHVLARFEADALGPWQLVARIPDAVLPDLAPQRHASGA